MVSIEAKDLGPGRSQNVKVSPSSGLSKEDVDRLVNEGEQFKEADETRKELAELRNQAETLLYTTEAALDGYRDLVAAEVLEEAKGHCIALRRTLDANGNLNQIRTGYQNLEALTFKIAESLYG